MIDLKKKTDTGAPLTEQEALAILKLTVEEMDALFEITEALRRKKWGNKVQLCSIVNAKSGNCSEDCTFCAQSSHYQTRVKRHPLLSEDALLRAYENATDLPIKNFSIVTSGKRISDGELDGICSFIKKHQTESVSICASLGTLREEQLKKLRRAGMKRFHHNLETAASFFPNICTTHHYEDRLKTVKAAQLAGLEVCCGGIFGLGESEKERVELAFALKKLNVDAIPLNFFIPIEGTPASELSTPLSAQAILKTIAMVALVNRQAEIKVCAGREHFLGNDEKHIFRAGASGMMTGNYLTVPGRTVDGDFLLLQEAGMEP